MPDKRTQRISLTFDRNVLKTKYTLFTYREARRFSTPIYNALVNELLEDGYLLTAEYFVKEIKKEQNYYREHVIGKRLLDIPELLFAIYDKCRMAEHAAKKERNLAAAAKLLYQMLLLLQSPLYKIQMSWLLEDIFEIVINISKRWLEKGTHPKDQLCRIYFNYAVALSRDFNNHEMAICYFDTAFEMAKGEEWSHDVMKGYTGSYQKLFYAIADEYLETIFIYVLNIIQTDVERANELVDRAMMISREVFVPKNVPSIVSGLCQLIELYSEQKNFTKAKIILQKIEIYLEKSDDQQMNFVLLNLYLARGVYYSESNKFDDAMHFLNAALNLAKVLDEYKYEATILFHMGNLFSWKGPHESRPAIKSYKRAAKIFNMLGNELNRQRCICKISKVMMGRLFPMVLQLMKSANTYCQMFYLRRWKTLLTPFWIGDNNILLLPIEDNIQCLLKQFDRKITK